MNLIDTKEIAEALNLSRDYVTRSVVKAPDFPPPRLRLSQKTVKWAREDFERWREDHYLRVAAQSR